MDKLVDFLFGDVDPVVRGDMLLDLVEVGADRVDENEGELLVDRHLVQVEVKVVEPVLVEPRRI